MKKEAGTVRRRDAWIRLVLVGLLLWTCNCSRGPFIGASGDADLKEYRLGQSRYYVSLPDGFQITEAHGKEGQLGYSLKPNDPSSTMYGFIEIEAGMGVKGDKLEPTGPVEYARSYLMNKSVTWTIERTSKGYLYANTDESGDLNAKASSKDRDELDRMISLIATLRTNF